MTKIEIYIKEQKSSDLEDNQISCEVETMVFSNSDTTNKEKICSSFITTQLNGVLDSIEGKYI